MLSLDHVNLTVENLGESISWYKRIFDFNVAESGVFKGKEYVVLRKDDCMLCLYQVVSRPPAASQSHRIYHFCFRIDDKDEWIAKIELEKLKVHSFQDYPYSLSWYIMDPTGYEIEVTYWKNGVIQFPQP